MCEPTSKKLDANFEHEWLEKILQSGHLTAEQHAQHLASLVQRLTKDDKRWEAFMDFRKYIYFSSCQKIKKRLEKGVRNGRSFVETLYASEPMLAVPLVSATPLSGRSQDADSDPLQGEDSGISQNEDWIKKHADSMSITFTLVKTKLGSTTVQHIQLDLGGIQNLRKLIRGIVNAITDLTNKICCLYLNVPVRRDKVAETANEVHKNLKPLLTVTWFLRKLLNCSPSLRRYLEAVPEGPALRKWLKKISQWEMAAHDILHPHIQKRLKSAPLSIYIIQPPPLRHPRSMATLDDTLAALFENLDDRVKAAQYLGDRAKRESDPLGLWQLVHEWHHGASERKNRSLWEESFPGTVHCESTMATIRSLVDDGKGYQTVLSKVFKKLSQNIADGRPHIGVSKRCCFSCASYIKFLSEGELSFGGTHGKCYPWSIPRYCSPHVRDGMLDILKQTMAPILRKHIRSLSARSDSSAGSDTQSPKDEHDDGYNLPFAEQKDIFDKYFEE